MGTEVQVLSLAFAAKRRFTKSDFLRETAFFLRLGLTRKRQRDCWLQWGNIFSGFFGSVKSVLERFIVAQRQTLDEVKVIVRESLKLGPEVELDDLMPLVGGEYDMDSLDILLVVTNIEKSFGIKIPDRSVGKSVFQTISTLADFVESHPK